MRVGVIGCGMIASEYHGPAIAAYAAAHADVELVACCDIDAARAEHFARTFGFAHHETDLRRFLDQYGLDAVCVLVSEHAMCEIACLAGKTGASLLLEKPPGRTVAELDRIIAAVDGSKSLVEVAFNRRYMPLVAALRRELAELGPSCPLHHIQFEMVRWNRHDDFSTTAIHGIDLVSTLAGAAYAQVDITYQAWPAIGPNVTNIHMNCRMGSGVTAQLAFMPVAGGGVERVCVHALDHSLYLELPIWDSIDAPGRLRHVAKRKLVSDLRGTSLPHYDEAPFRDGFYGEDAAFFDAVREGRVGLAGLHKARQSVAIAEAIRCRQVRFVETRYESV